MRYRTLFSKNGLSLERLATLVAVDEAGHIAAAAPDDQNKQAVISRQLSSLESFFQVELKNKAGKTIRLTPAGRELARTAREHLQALEGFQRDCRNQPMEVTIGAGESLLQWLVVPRFKALRDSMAGASIELRDLQNLAICQQLQDHVIDFGLLRSDLATRGSLVGKSLGNFGYSLFVPERLCPRTAKRSEVALLQELPLATQGGNTVFQNQLLELAAGENWKLNIQLLGESHPQVAQALSTGEVAVILPDVARLALSLDSIWVQRLTVLDCLRRTIFLAWHPHRLETRPSLAGIPKKLAHVLQFTC